MAKRIEPYRDYSEHDVVNNFALDTADKFDGSATVAVAMTDWAQGAAGGDYDAGVVVYVSAGSLPGDTPAQSTSSSDKLRSYMGASHSTANIGYAAYPYNDMLVAPASGQGPALGITLRETLAYDENGEKMLYYPQKADEAQAVLPGQSVPVLTAGTVLLNENAFESNPTLGQALNPATVAETAGKLVPQDTADAMTVGHVIATGKQSDDSGESKFLCRLNFNGGK